jgi:hypothetical protein
MEVDSFTPGLNEVMMSCRSFTRLTLELNDNDEGLVSLMLSTIAEHGLLLKELVMCINMIDTDGIRNASTRFAKVAIVKVQLYQHCCSNSAFNCDRLSFRDLLMFKSTRHWRCMERILLISNLT